MKQSPPSTAAGHRRVMIVEDEPRLRQMLQRAVRDMEFTVETATSGEEALTRLKESPADILILDLNLPGMSGIELFERVHQSSPHVQGIVLTGYGDLDSAKRAIRLNIADFLTKPCTLAEIEAALDRAVRRVAAAAHPLSVSGSISGGGAGGGGDASELFQEPPPDPASPATTLHDVERQHILTTLSRHGGNREATAAELGISVRTLYYRLSEYQKQGHYQP